MGLGERMPTYRFQCDSCEGYYEEVFHGYEERGPFECKCGGSLERTMKGCIPGLKFVGKGWNDKDRKIDEHMDWVGQVMAEPVCASEIDEGKDMLREREQEKGYPEGYLTGDRPQETKLVEAKTGQQVDISKMVDAGLATQGAVEKKIADSVKAGDLVEVKQTKLQGAEKIKKRAKAQAAERRRTTGS